jgi:hypothetical protein
MTLDDEAEILALMRAARERSRGYADFFGWAINRDLEESGVISSLVESMATDGLSFYENVKSRCRPNDPPDCEAIDCRGERVAIEVTELVDGEAIRAFKEGRVYDWAEWTRDKFIASLAERIYAKDKRHPFLNEPPYEGGYVVVVHTDEPELTQSTVREYLKGHGIPKPVHISRVILVLSYDPAVQRCPYFELPFNGSQEAPLT